MATGLRLLSFQCTACGTCCRSVRVPLTHADLRRLVRSTTASPSTLVEWLGPDELDLSGEPSTFVILPSGRRAMVLRHQQAACTLLRPDGRCGAYDSRPLTCRLFPFDVALGRRSGIRRLQLLPMPFECPHTRDGRRDPRATARLAGAAEAELRDHHSTVARWNRAQQWRRRMGRRLGTADEFFALVGCGS